MEASVITRSSAATLEDSIVAEGRNRKRSKMTHNPIRNARTQDKHQSPKLSSIDDVRKFTPPEPEEPEEPASIHIQGVFLTADLEEEDAIESKPEVV